MASSSSYYCYYYYSSNFLLNLTKKFSVSSSIIVLRFSTPPYTSYHLSHKTHLLPSWYFQIVQCSFEMSLYLTENSLLHSLVSDLQLFVLCSLVSHKVRSVSIPKAITQMHVCGSSCKERTVFHLLVKQIVISRQIC